MMDEGSRSAMQVMNVSHSHFVLHHGEVIGEDEPATTVNSEERTPKAAEEEAAFWRRQRFQQKMPIHESVLEERCDDAQIQVVIDNLP